ncbi:MAG: hypothetical protein E7105_00600 [Prevotella sp.]|nr:hypothetical protein [Prevotella sp.]
MTPQRYTLFLNAHKKAAEIHQPQEKFLLHASCHKVKGRKYNTAQPFQENGQPMPEESVNLFRMDRKMLKNRV